VACIILAYNNTTKPRKKHIDITWHNFKDQLCAGHITLVTVRLILTGPTFLQNL